MKINQLKKREILLIIVFTIFLLHVYIGGGTSVFSSIFPQPLVSFLCKSNQEFLIIELTVE